jgi:hypothetical protein
MPKDNDDGKSPQEKGGIARREALTPEERTEISRGAARARWDANVPQASHEGPLKIGNTTINAAVLPNGKRILSQGSFLMAIGRSRTPKAGTGALTTVDGLPFFLQAEALKPFISDALRETTTPIFFRTKDGKRALGYDAQLLPQVCEVYLKFKDACLMQSGRVPTKYQHIVQACDVLMRGMAHVGIVALVDEATGYQYDRARTALADILEAYISKDLARWAKTFSDDFYKEIFRLRGWKVEDFKKRPGVVGLWTADIVYARLAPGVLARLKEITPRNERGQLKHHMHRWLTREVGDPALREHLGSVTTIMKLAKDWRWFMGTLDRLHPKYNTTLLLPFNKERSEPA